MPDDDTFYIGYLPKAPDSTAVFIRGAVAATALIALIVAGGSALTLRYAGNGEFEFGRPREVRGVVRRDFAPPLQTGDADYLLVGYGKNRQGKWLVWRLDPATLRRA